VAELPRSAVVGAPLADVLAAVGLQPSKAAARRLIKVRDLLCMALHGSAAVQGAFILMPHVQAAASAGDLLVRGGLGCAQPGVSAPVQPCVQDLRHMLNPATDPATLVLSPWVWAHPSVTDPHA